MVVLPEGLCLILPSLVWHCWGFAEPSSGIDKRISIPGSNPFSCTGNTFSPCSLFQEKKFVSLLLLLCCTYLDSGPCLSPRSRAFQRNAPCSHHTRPERVTPQPATYLSHMQLSYVTGISLASHVCAFLTSSILYHGFQ